MKLFEKIKNAIFEEEEEFDEEFENTEVPKKKIKVEFDEDEELKRRLRKRAMEERKRVEEEEMIKEPEDDLNSELVKQIDVEKTTSKKDDEVDLLKERILNESTPKTFPKRESRRSPIIFDDEDFSESITKIKKPQNEKEEEITKSKSLYGGYRDEKQKEKFRPSPNISPVYGLVEVSPVLNKTGSAPKENHVYVPKKQEEVSLEEVRQKAFGNEPYFEEEEDLGLLYDMNEKEKPEVAKVTLGDAEEYFNDLGLEYNVDYTDKKTVKNTTRSIKNEKLSNEIEKEIKDEKEKDLEITKEQLKPRTADEIKKIKKIDNTDIEDDPDEKNLYDLIDMMYDSE